MFRLGLLLVSLFLTSAAPAPAQSDAVAEFEPLILTLSPTGAVEASVFLLDTRDPTTATRGLGVAYVHVPGSAGTVTLHAGLFERVGTKWQFVVEVTDLFGGRPRDPIFFDTHMELTTNTLGPNDARCCPSVEVRWSVDWVTGQATRLN